MMRLLSITLAVFVVFCGALFGPTANGSQISIEGLFNTGIGADDTLLSVGGHPDPHYTLDGNPAVVVGHNPAWIAPPDDARWISFPNGSFSVGVASLHSLPLLIESGDPQSASITGRLSSDNDASIFLNGQQVPFNNSGPQFTA